MNADGSGVRKLTSESSDDLEPTWSRDGRKIAFTSDREGGKRNLWTIDVDPEGTGLGTNPTQVASGTLGIAGPAFSPASNRLAYAKARSTAPDFDICVTDLDVAPPAERCLTFKTAPDQDPAWSPDGTADPVHARHGRRAGPVPAAGRHRGERASRDLARRQQPLPPAGVVPRGGRAAAGRHRARAHPDPEPDADPRPGGSGAEPEDTRPDPGTAGDPGAFLGLDQPHRTRVKGFRRLGIVVTARCVGVERGTVKLAVGAKLARKLGLKQRTLAERARALRRRPEGGRAAQARREGPQAARHREGPQGDRARRRAEDHRDDGAGRRRQHAARHAPRPDPELTSWTAGSSR